MKRIGNLWDELISWPNLMLAAKKAQRGKRERSCVQRFAFSIERELHRLHAELRDGGYRPGGFHEHWITRPKPRLISAAPYRDRVVHHALMNILEPVLEKRFSPFSFACRKEKGTHAAADHLQAMMRRYRFVMQCDIRKFFPSIDHEILKRKLKRIIKDQRVLELMDLIVDSSNPQESRVEYFAGDDLWTPVLRPHGLPIGNLTSQWFANWMLNDLDHLVKGDLGIGGYVRYCDDFVLLDDDRDKLRAARSAIDERLADDRLRLHSDKVRLVAVERGITFVGYRVWPKHRLLRKENVRSFRRRVRWMRLGYGRGEIQWEQIKPRLASWMGHARQANSERLIRRLSREWHFTRGGVEGSCFAGRVVEQQSAQLPLCQP
ncbi:MAG: RNA-dependent DNA polymerase [Phycisphaerae bacterium]|nr:RNA-dependent DNA polymerase [Phycisphaerae bacterium]